mmetsp:Transcript_87541/g.228387  ORF Transcript_87541/g.228387 Transcript_87541/m.228387 type:complete len:297 (-) Transcript_87541:776-1666(-)
MCRRRHQVGDKSKLRRRLHRAFRQQHNSGVALLGRTAVGRRLRLLVVLEHEGSSVRQGQDPLLDPCVQDGGGRRSLHVHMVAREDNCALQVLHQQRWEIHIDVHIDVVAIFRVLGNVVHKRIEVVHSALLQPQLWGRLAQQPYVGSSHVVERYAIFRKGTGFEVKVLVDAIQMVLRRRPERWCSHSCDLHSACLEGRCDFPGAPGPAQRVLGEIHHQVLHPALHNVEEVVQLRQIVRIDEDALVRSRLQLHFEQPRLRGSIRLVVAYEVLVQVPGPVAIIQTPKDRCTCDDEYEND